MKTLQLTILDTKVREGLDFILNHFETYFARTVSTKTTENKQLLVSTKEQAIARFKQSNYLDCRINAYCHSDTSDKGPINFLFIDLDMSAFEIKDELDKALASTLDRIKERLNGEPTVLWTGNGYHVYQPLESAWFSNYSEFNKFEEVNKKFLRYAATFLSYNNSDKCNYPSPKSCMLRIPYTLNSKCVDSGLDPEVKIIQKWNGERAKVFRLIGNFYAYLTNEKLKEKEEWKNRSLHSYSNSNSANTSYLWIETLLETPIEDFRKNAVSLILIPYLITVKKLGIERTSEQIKLWLNRCNNLRTLDFRVDYKIRTDIDYTRKNKMKPLKFENLKTRNQQLYNLLKNKVSG